MTTKFYQSLPDDEKSAVDAVFEAANRLVPFGYFVGFLSPEDAMRVAPHLTLAVAREALRSNEEVWDEYLVAGEEVSNLMGGVFAEQYPAPDRDSGTG